MMKNSKNRQIQDKKYEEIIDIVVHLLFVLSFSLALIPIGSVLSGGIVLSGH